jgi:WD40 repeat protein/predicted Ser/Thr protein kinase
MPAVNVNLAKLSDEDRLTIEHWLLAFDQSWTPEAFAQHVKQLPAPDSTLRLPALMELVKIDLERSWRQHLPRLVETYLESFPELGNRETVPADLLLAEHEARQQVGVSSSVEHFRQRFPQRADDLQRLIDSASAEHRESELSAATRSTPQPRPSTASAAEPGKARRQMSERFGRYRIIRKLGHGGMGAVYLAHDDHLDRQVALKVPRFDPEESDEIRERFVREARAAATIDHPNICAVHDVGEIEGQPYLTMAYVEGKPLSHLTREGNPLPQVEAAALVRKLALALQEAHDRGVIHRDLKPGNVMLNQRQEPVIMDFGLARRIDKAEERLTRTGSMLGTTAYLPPELVTGQADWSAGGDVYCLGVILYELLTAHLPYEGKSTAVLAQIATRPPPLSQHRPDIDPALAGICMRAMARDLKVRFGSMREFARELEKYLARSGHEQPMPAASDSAPKACNQVTARGRRRLLTAVAAAAVLGLAFGTVILVRSPEGTIRIELLGDAEGAEVRVNGKEVAISNIDEPLHLKVRSDHQLEITGKKFKTVSKMFEVRRGANPALRITLEPNAPPEAKTGPLAARQGEPPLLPRELPRGKAPLDSLRRDLIPRDLLAEAGGGDPERAPKEIVAILGGARLRPWGPVQKVIFSPNNRLLASSSLDHTVRLWDATAWNEVRALTGHTAAVHGISFSKDGSRLASCSDDGTLRIWSTATGRQIDALRKEGAGTVTVTFRPDDRFIVSGGWDGTITVWDPVARTVRHTLKGHTAGIRPLEFLGNGPVLASGSVDGEVCFWNTDTGAKMGTLKAHARELNLAVTHDGKMLATVSWDRGVKLWQLTDAASAARENRPIQATLVHPLKARSDVHGVAFSPDGKWLITGGLGHLAAWDVRLGKEVAVMSTPHQPIVHSVAFASDGKIFVSGGSTGPMVGTGNIQVWETKTWAPIRPGDFHSVTANVVAMSADGKYIAAGNTDNTITLFDAALGRAITTLRKHDSGLKSLAFHPDATMLASGSWDPNVKLWEIPSGQLLHTLTGHTFAVNGVAFDSRGNYLVSASGDMLLKSWEIAAGFPPPVKTIRGPKTWLSICALHPTEPVAACGDGEGKIHLWNIKEGRRLSRVNASTATGIIGRELIESREQA